MSFTNYTVPLKVTNNCEATIWPGVATQKGTGPGTGGFELASRHSRDFNVSWDWQGRLWGRTNCSFNANGTAASNLNGVNGNGAACLSGDCFGRLDCQFTGAVPSTLAEFNLWGGVNGGQTFYDISLVDGYNLPIGIVYIPGPNTTYIPPNLVNAACIATPGWLGPPASTGTDHYTNASYPIPYESRQTNDGVGRWCPWDLQVYPPSKPGDGVYPYPDDAITRPAFDPCFSACAKWNRPEDCCSGDWNDPNKCKGNLFSSSAKSVCPDAYSFAYDDQTSTFIIPSGGGWEVVFCPAGRSTNILVTFGEQLRALASSGSVSREAASGQLDNKTYIEEHNKQRGGASANGSPVSLAGLLMVAGAVTILGMGGAV